MLKNTQNAWSTVKNFFSIGPKTKTTKTHKTIKVSRSDSETLKSEICKKISAASQDMLEKAFSESVDFFHECNEELKKCDCIGDTDSEAE